MKGGIDGAGSGGWGGAGGERETGRKTEWGRKRVQTQKDEREGGGRGGEMEKEDDRLALGF